jgi:hypothetical protein
MLNLDEQTKSGAVMLAWSFLSIIDPRQVTMPTLINFAEQTGSVAVICHVGMVVDVNE